MDFTKNIHVFMILLNDSKINFKHSTICIYNCIC
nr:MAG TPA: hypothetical protein [Caudoviricetes sp.]DAS51750.1 MAG TPA: hypothetical protein [Caudoviricetes sp.]